MADIMKDAPEDMERFRKLPKEEMLAELVESCNAEEDEEGMKLLPCEVCHGKGKVYYAYDMAWETKPCVCTRSRYVLDYLKRVGLMDLLTNSTLDRYEPYDDITKALKERVIEYTKTKNWLFLGGQSGSGKTHLAMGVFGKLLKQYRVPRLMMWIQDSQRLKSLVTDEEEYDRVLRPLMIADVLIIDDFFNLTPTAADIKLARSIIDYRYLNRLQTIITSECSIKQICEYDDAIGGRIAELCTPKYCLNIKPGMEHNYRMRGIV